MRKIYKILAFLFVYGFIVSLTGMAEEDFIKSAMDNYNNAHYEKARDYFEKALAAGVKEERLEFVKYALEKIESLKSYFGDIEKEEEAFKLKTHDGVLKNALVGKHHMLAKILMQGKFYLAIVEPHLKRAVELDPKNVEAYFDLGSAYYAAMRYPDAVKNYEKAISLDPNNPRIYRIAGDASSAIGDFDKARKFYSDAIKTNDEFSSYSPAEIEKIKTIINILPETYKDIDILLKEERFDEAEDILNKRISLDHSDYIAITELGDLYFRKGDRKTALTLLKKATKIAPDYPIVHFFLGHLYFVMQKSDEAVSEFNIFKTKMKLLPKMDDKTKKMYIGDLHYICEVYFTLERYEDFRKEIDEILRLDPKNQDAFYNLGIYYYVYGHNRPKTYEYLKKVVELDSTTRIAKKAKYAIEYIRHNPDYRFSPDFSFIDTDY